MLELNAERGAEAGAGEQRCVIDVSATGACARGAARTRGQPERATRCFTFTRVQLTADELKIKERATEHADAASAHRDERGAVGAGTEALRRMQPRRGRAACGQLGVRVGIGTVVRVAGD